MEIKQRPLNDTKMPKQGKSSRRLRLHVKTFARKRGSISPSTVKSLQHSLANDSLVRILSIISIGSARPILRSWNLQTHHVISVVGHFATTQLHQLLIIIFTGHSNKTWRKPLYQISGDRRGSRISERVSTSVGLGQAPPEKFEKLKVIWCILQIVNFRREKIRTHPAPSRPSDTPENQNRYTHLCRVPFCSDVLH